MKELLIILALFLIPSVAFGAIGFDTVTRGSLGISTTSIAWTHTVTGSNPMLVFCFTNTSGSDLNPSATVNGSSVPLIQKMLTGDTASWTYMFLKNAPSTGSNNIFISWGSSATVEGSSASYTGVASSQPEASSTESSGASTTYTSHITTVTANSWTFSCDRGASGGTFTAGAGTTLRDTNDLNLSLLDSNAAIPAASSTALNINSNTSQAWGDVMISFAPAAAAPAVSNPMQVIWY